LKSKFFVLLAVLPFIFIFGGCGLWQDFTTYFNLYHNAKTLYYDAEELIIKDRKDIFFVSDAAIPAAASQNLPKVIEKFSKLLQFHQESSYVDDALFLIGKAFYYQKSYIKASRKFQELIATQPNSDLVLEATLWLGKSEMQMKKFDDGMKYLQEAKNRALEEKDEDVLAEVYIEEVRYLKFQEKYPEAVQKLKEIVALDLSDDLSSKALYETGEIYFKQLNNPAPAADAYKKTLEFSPPYDVEYNSNLNYNICLRELGKMDEALNNFEAMGREFKYQDKIDEIYLQTGLTLKKLGKFNEAYKQFYVLDTLAMNSSSSGIARFELGDMFENNLMDFDSAYVYYLKAEKSASTADYLKKIREKAGLFKRYEGLQTNLYVYSRQLAYIADPKEYKRDSLKYYADSADARLADLFNFPNDTPTDTSMTDSLKIAADSLKALQDSLAKISGEGGNPEMTNPEDEFAIGRPRPGDNTGKEGDGTGGNPPVAIEKKGWAPVRATVPEDSLKSLLAKTYFDLGNVFFGEIIIPDSAFNYYNKLLTEFPDSKYQGQALFSLGSYYLDKKDNAVADSLFEVVYENYKDESVANLAADKLGKPKIVQKVSPADKLFEDAEKIYVAKKYDEAVQKYYSVFLLYPETFTAPKSLLAAGFVLENDLQLLDSAFAVYDTLVSRYPQTRFSNSVLSKVKFYKSEKERIEKEIQDSLKAIRDSVVADSIAKHTPPPDSAGVKEPVKDSTAVMKTPGKDSSAVQQEQPGVPNEPSPGPNSKPEGAGESVKPTEGEKKGEAAGEGEKPPNEEEPENQNLEEPRKDHIFQEKTWAILSKEGTYSSLLRRGNPPQRSSS